MDKVEIHQAYMWECPWCYIENFERAIRVDMDEDKARELAIELGVIESWETSVPESMFLMAPNQVKCKHCLKDFETEDDRI